MNFKLRKTFSLLFGFCLGTGIVFSQDSWERIQNLPIQGRMSATSFSIGFDGYVGLGETDTLLNNFYSVSFIDNTWRNVSPFPGSSRKGSVSFVIDDYAFVGLGVSEDGYERDFWKYDPSNDSWQEVATFPGTGRAYSVADTFDGYGYVLTGIDSSGYPTDVWRYNAESNVWEQMNAFGGAGRTNAYIFSINNTLYVGNGYQGSMFENVGYKYLPETDTWEELEIFTGALRQGTAYAAANGKGYFGLGYNSRDWWEFAPDTEEWTQTTAYGDSEESNVGAASALTIADRIFVVSGYKSTAMFEGEIIQDVYKFTPEMEFPSECSGYNYNQTNARRVQVNFYGDQDFEKAPKLLVRKKENDENWIFVDTIESGFSYVDTTLLEDSYYSYAVAAYNANCIGDFVPGHSVHTFNYIEAPQQFSLEKDNYNDINISWRDMSSDEDAYVIELKTGGTNDFDVVTSLPQNSESYVFKNPQKEVVYQFRIITYSDILENDTSELKQIAFTEPGRWETINPFPGTGRVEATSFVLDGEAYMGLGRSEDYSCLKDFWKFNASTNEWIQINDFPGEARAGAAVFTIDNYAYVGTGCNPDSLFSDFWRYNPIDDSWTQIEDFGGGGRALASSFSLSGNGYVGYGAIDLYWTTAENDFWKYNPSNNTWTEVTSITSNNVVGTTCFAIADTGYVIAGKEPYTLFAYYPETDEWEEKNILNTHFDYMSGSYSFVIGEKAYIAGGYGNYYHLYGFNSRDTWEYDPVSNQFFFCADMEFYQYNHVGFALDGKGYVFTGNAIDNSGYDYNTTKAQVFYPDSLPDFPEPEANWEEDKLVVRWNDISFSENGYNLYRSYGTDEYQLQATLPEDSVSYSDILLSMEELDTVNYKVEVFWDDNKIKNSETMRIRPLYPPEIISMEAVAYNEVDITVKKKSKLAEAFLLYRQNKNGNWGSSPYYEYNNYINEIEDTIVTVRLYDNTLDELELLNFKAENILQGDFYSFYSGPKEFSGAYTLLRHPVLDTMIRTENGVSIIWSLKSNYADSVSVKRTTLNEEGEPELIATLPEGDTTYFDSDVADEDVYVYYLTAFNDSAISKVTTFSTNIYTSVDFEQKHGSVSLYPNPVVNELYIDLPQDYSTEKTVVRLYNLSGVVIEQIQLKSTGKIKLPLSHLKQGIYIVEINAGGEKQFRKIIKE